MVGVLIFGVTRGEKRAVSILRAVGERIPGVGGDKLEQIALRAAESIRDLGTNREVLIWSLTWAALNWLLDAASLWCFIAAFGGRANPVGLFAAYGVANVVGAIPITPGGLGIIDTLTPFLLVGFGLTRSLAWEGIGVGITANCIFPAARTRMTDSIADPTIVATLDRYFQPEHVSAVVVWLTHQDTKINNEAFRVSGGSAGRVTMAVLASVRVAESTPEMWAASQGALMANGALTPVTSTAEMFGMDLADANPEKFGNIGGGGLAFKN